MEVGRNEVLLVEEEVEEERTHLQGEVEAEVLTELVEGDVLCQTLLPDWHQWSPCSVSLVCSDWGS